MLDPSITFNLAPDDDPYLWEIATNTILGEAGRLCGGIRDDVFAQVGCCRHWISPHRRVRWAADGGFAGPFGYDKTTTGFSYRALPEFDWSVFLRWTGDAWEHGRTGRRCLLLRVAIPGRTARHQQAAIHTVWLPHSPTSKERALQLYGFRKNAGKWRYTARSGPLPGIRRPLHRPITIGTKS